MGSYEIGSKWERRVVDYMQECGLSVKRSVAHGHADTGDIDGLELFAVDCKSHKRLTLWQWLVQVRKERRVAEKPFGVVVVEKRDAVDEGHAAVVMELSQFVTLLHYIEEVRV